MPPDGILGFILLISVLAIAIFIGAALIAKTESDIIAACDNNDTLLMCPADCHVDFSDDF